MLETNSTILAIDDQEDNLALLDAVLSAQGYQVLLADGGIKGLQTATRMLPDLILLDLAMPVMDGFQVLQALRAAPSTQAIPIIVLTANFREPAMVERGFELGATEYLTKPIHMEELLVRLRSTLRLARAERELGQLRNAFSAMLVHDLRAPLDGVKLALSTLRRAESEGSARRELFDQALEALGGMGQLVDDLLNVQRLEEASFTPQSRPLELGQLLLTQLAPFRALAAERGLALTLDSPPEPLPMVADATLLRRVVDNLVSNALKFTESGSIKVSVTRTSDTVSVSVSDTGPGIPKDTLPRVFDRFYHVAQRQATRQGGFGLGLAFCQSALRAMGGAIAVESLEGQGSTFLFTLPLHAKAPAKIPADGHH